MTASAVGNTPEGNIDNVKATIMRGTMLADQRLFNFKVCLVSFFVARGAVFYGIRSS